MIKISNKRTPLKWSMVLLLILCWILPLAIIAYAMLYVTTNKINSQIERTIVTSADNAIKICEIRMNMAVEASKNASYLPEIKKSWNQYKKDGSRVNLFSSVTRFMERQYSTDENILNAALFFTEEPELTYYARRSGSTTNTTYRDSLYFKENVQDAVINVYQELGTDIKFINVDGHIYMIRNIMDPSYNPYAVITLELDKDIIFGSLSSTWGYVSGDIYIDKKFLVSDEREEALFPDGNVPEELFAANNREARVLQKDREYYAYAVRKPAQYSIGYIISLNGDAIIDETENIKFVCILFILFMLPLIVIVFMFFHKKVTQPIKRLVNASHTIEEGQFGHQIKQAGNSREFEYLTEAFNSMSERLKYQFETIYSEELALKDARIMALQSQINPHFLNNTLEIINWEARINDNYQVSRMIENLSIMLEATMDRRHRRFVTLAEEMSYVDAYLYIIACRLGERLHVEKNVDETLLNVKIPRLIIQPIIENAVEHGVSGQTHGKVAINVFARAENLVIEVRNSGTMSKEDEDKIKILLDENYEPGEFGSASLGIRNVNRRIKIIYGENSGLSVHNDENNETVSEIIVKIDYDNNKRQ